MSRTRSFDAQEGFTLAGLIVILTIMSIIIAFTVPEQWSMVMGRERDRQTIFLMKQYARGIRAWQQKHQAVPTSLDQLAQARKPRMLRGDGKWPMPLTGNPEDWILVPVGAIDQAAGVVAGNPTGQPVDMRDSSPVRPGPRAPSPTPGAAGPSRLRKDASPKDYIGPFIAVRPNASGPSYISFNGAEDYSEWVYTVQDLEIEIQRRMAALAAK